MNLTPEEQKAVAEKIEGLRPLIKDAANTETYRVAFLELWEFINASIDHENNDYNCPDDRRDDGECGACVCRKEEMAILEKYKALRDSQ